MDKTQHNPPKLMFDAKLIARRQVRARKIDTDRFIWERVLENTRERLAVIKREFPKVLVSAPPELAALFTAKFTASNRQIDTSPPVNNGGYDLVVSLMHLHFENDVPGRLKYLTTQLKPDGFFLCGFFGGQTLARMRHILYQAEDSLYGRVSPRIAPMIRLDQAVQLLQHTGLALPVADRDVLNVSYKNLAGLYQDLRAMGQTNALVARDKRPVSRRFFKAVEALYRSEHGDMKSRLPVCFEILWLSGWAPHPDQPKALRPGSAKTRLADALGVKEIGPQS